MVEQVHDKLSSTPTASEVEAGEVQQQGCLLLEHCYEYLELNPSREFKR